MLQDSILQTQGTEHKKERDGLAQTFQQNEINSKRRRRDGGEEDSGGRRGEVQGNPGVGGDTEIIWKPCMVHHISDLFSNKPIRQDKGILKNSQMQCKSVERDTTSENIKHFFAGVNDKHTTTFDKIHYARRRLSKKTAMTALQSIRTRIRHKGGDQKNYRNFITQSVEIQTAEEHDQTHSQSTKNELPIAEKKSQQLDQNEITKSLNDQTPESNHDEQIDRLNIDEPQLHSTTNIRPDSSFSNGQVNAREEQKSRIIRCPWITDRGICSAEKATAHMQLWYDDGYRSIHCQTCKKMSRSTHWKCHHGIQWHKCLEHCEDPPEHRTIRMNNGGQRVNNAVTGTLLPADRPEPQTKKQRASRVNVRSAGMKRVIQNENPTEFKIDWSKCPKLASKFPHLHIERDLELVGHTESSSSTTFESPLIG